jgi:6-phosphogluconolactonase
VTAYGYDAGRGALTVLQSISTVPDGYAGANSGADLHLTPDGRFLLASNRGHDSIAQFAVARESGALTPMDFVPTGGRTPRGFAIDPTGRYVLAANQDSHSIVSLKIDRDTGAIKATGHRTSLPSPVCLKLFAPLASGRQSPER